MSETGKQNDWLTIQQVADRWNVGYETVRQQVLKGKIPTMPVGTLRRISIKAIEQIEAKAHQVESVEAVRRVKRASAFAASGKDYYPDR